MKTRKGFYTIIEDGREIAYIYSPAASYINFLILISIVAAYLLNKMSVALVLFGLYLAFALIGYITTRSTTSIVNDHIRKHSAVISGSKLSLTNPLTITVKK